MSESNVDKNLNVECSDDENYGNSQDNHRLVDGKRIWEPTGEQIGQLYQQLESKGFIELRWQCPGRRSPSVHSLINTINSQKNCDTSDHDTNNTDNLKTELNEFDFETDFNNETTIGTKVQPRKRSNQGLKKTQTDLSKVMQDIKKYQFIDQQTKKLSLQTVSTPSTPTVTTPSVNVTITSTNTTQSSTDTPQTN